jgi:hypothetical protein
MPSKSIHLLTPAEKEQRRHYWIWAAMIQRCTNPNNRQYHNYGGRGITVCDRWRNFQLFTSDMGERPTPQHTIDRIDNDAGYSPENCSWVERHTNNLNKRLYRNNSTGVRNIERRDNGTYRIRVRRKGVLVLNASASNLETAVSILNEWRAKHESS